jgi:hypothetical protein
MGSAEDRAIAAEDDGEVKVSGIERSREIQRLADHGQIAFNRGSKSLDGATQLCP